jgi:DNA-binding MarR family transcriptional regulator
LSFAVHDVLTRVAAEFHLSVTQLRLLGLLRDRTPPMTLIAEHLGLDRSSVTGLIDRAERRGLVSRSTSSEDARVTIVSATPAAFALGRQLAPKIMTEIEALMGPVPRVGREWLERAAASALGARLDGRRLPAG